MQATSAASVDDDDDDLAAIPPPGGLRVGSVCRLVKKATSKAFNRAASAASDADAVARFLDDPDGPDGLSVSSLPVFANARAGLWHVDLNSPRVQLCRFKSTDGHAAAAGGAGGSFPLSRLNLNVAAAAAAAGAAGRGRGGGGGGAVIVDATRKGKRFPDALSRTIPIWAAVVNRACRIWAGGGGGGREKGEAGGGREGAGEARPAPGTLPPWVPASERARVAERVEGWARLLLSTGVDLSAFARELSERPLVPVWVARRGGRGGGGGGAATGKRPPLAVEVTRAEGGESGATASASAAAATVLYLFSASDPSARRATVSCRCSSGSSGSSGGGSGSSGGSGVEAASRHPSHSCFDLSFDYEPGGGDDEEGWSRGLSARLFWEHRGELLSRGPGGFEEAAEELVRRRKSGRGGVGGAQGAGGGREGDGEGGGREAGASARSGAPRPAWSFVCGTRLAVGNAAAAAAFCRKRGLAPAVVILSGSGSGDGDGSGSGSGSGAPSPPSPPSSSSPSASSSSSSPLCFRAPVPPRKKLGLLEALPSVVAFASAHLLGGRTVLLASGGAGGEGAGGDNESGNENAAAAAAAVLLACFSAPPRAEFLRAFGGGGGGCGGDSPPSRPCGCPAPPRASREEVRARVAAVCGSAAAAAAAATTGEGDSSPSPLFSLPLSVGKEAAKQLLMFASPPDRPGGFACPACRAGRPARIGSERAAAAALGEEQRSSGRETAEGATTGASSRAEA